MLNTLNNDPPDMVGSTFFIAKVVDNEDPLQKQRVRVLIPGLLEGETENLPWLLPVQHAPWGAGVAANVGTMGVPHVDDLIVVVFQHGDLNRGLWLGATTFNQQSLGVLLTNYPRRYGFVDHVQNHFYIDTTDGQTDVEFRHNSGTTIHIRDTGTIDIHVVEDVNTQVDRHVNLTVNGNVTGLVQGTADLTVEGNVTATLNSNLQATVNGSATISVQGGIVSDSPTWAHTGNINIDGLVTVTQDVVADGISLVTHVHGGVQGGPSTTAEPQ